MRWDRNGGKRRVGREKRGEFVGQSLKEKAEGRGEGSRMSGIYPCEKRYYRNERNIWARDRGNSREFEMEKHRKPIKCKYFAQNSL